MYLKTFRLSRISAGLLLAVASTTQAIEPSDPLYESSIYIGPSYTQWGLQALNLEAAWDLSRGHAYLALVDSGIDTDHPDLVGNFRPHFSYDFGSCHGERTSRTELGNEIFHCVDGIGDSNVDELASDDDFYYGDQPRAGHGTHVAGIMAATSNNNIGSTGICWNCSLMVSKARRFESRVEQADWINVQANALEWQVKNGAQVINLSSGGRLDSFLAMSGVTCDTLPADYQGPNATAEQTAAVNYCNVLDTLEEWDVVFVAAAGNGNDYLNDEIQFPASDPRTISVAATDINGSATPQAGSISTNVSGDERFELVHLSSGPELDLVAPGFNILSTFYYSPTDEYNDGNLYEDGAVWSDVPESGNEIFRPECADYISVISGYGPCSGTSMATPHVSGIAGLLRSINPLLKKDQIKEALTKHASQHNAKDNVYGYGVPDAFASVKDVLGESDGQQLVNRVTPLFGLYSSAGRDHLYTTKPQMAMAAMYGALQPQPEIAIQWDPNYYDAQVPGYSSFPKPGLIWDIPLASAFILTTHTNPFNPNSELVPLYRLSRQTQHSWNTRNVDHTYATQQSEIDAYITDGYQLDGVEGYIFPDNETQQLGTVRLYRKYNPNHDDHAIFPESKLSLMTSRGYTQDSHGRSWIGYVYPNQDSDGDGLVDGFERIAGTGISDTDSDDDGVTDGVEINNYPYGDPLDHPLVP